MKILVTGSEGFIGKYVVKELLENGHKVIGIDNFSKYGQIPTLEHPNFDFYEYDAKDLGECQGFGEDIESPDMIIALAAIIGGISLFHKYAYDLIAENDRIIAATCDFAKEHKVKKIVVMSSSMVFETVTEDIKEEMLGNVPPPFSTYGFQKLSCEYFVKGLWQQYGIPYLVIRPFNAIGIGEYKSKYDKDSIISGELKMTMSHVIPDFIYKILHNQNPMRIFGDGSQVRSFTSASDIAKGIRIAMESNIVNDHFNIVCDENVRTMKELAYEIFELITGKDRKELSFLYEKAFEHDVQRRVCYCDKFYKTFGWKPKTKLQDVMVELIKWSKENIDLL